jgi:hypothetical protein
MHAEIGEFFALQQAKKSFEAKVARARRGLPAVGLLPYGRTFNKKTEQWGVDEARQRKIRAIAERYLAGESMEDLAILHGMSLSGLYRTLTTRCGDSWTLVFRSARLNAHEQVTIPIPRLLPEELIDAIKARTQLLKTYRVRKYRHLLAKFIYCRHCGLAMFGDVVRGRRIYRHNRKSRRPCPHRTRSVDAERLDRRIMLELFDLFGNPAKVRRAIEDAIPDRSKARALEGRKVQIHAELSDVKKQRDRLIHHVQNGTIRDDDVAPAFNALDEKQGALRHELGMIDNQLANVPEAGEIKRVGDWITGKFYREVKDKRGRVKRRVVVPRHRLIADLSNGHFERMSWEDQRELIEMLFLGRTPAGRPYGVSIEPVPGSRRTPVKDWQFTMLGKLVHSSGTVPAELIEPPEDFEGGERQDELLYEVCGTGSMEC